MSRCLWFSFRLLRGTFSRAPPETGISNTRWEGLQLAIPAWELCLLVGGVSRERVCLVVFKKTPTWEFQWDSHESDVKNVVEKTVKQHKLHRKNTCVASPTKPETNFEHFSLNSIETGVWWKSSPHKAWRNTSHRSACILRTEAPGRQSTQTRTQASPAVAESEARLAIAFLVVDNSGPAAAGSEFAASVMRHLRRPIRLCSRQMSRRMTSMKSRRTPPVYSHIAKERFAGWSILGSIVQRLQLVWVECPQKTTKTTLRMIWYHMLVSWLHEPEKKIKKMTWLVLVRARTAVKILLRYSTEKIQSNPMEHFQTSVTMSRCLERTKTAVALPHSS